MQDVRVVAQSNSCVGGALVDVDVFVDVHHILSLRIYLHQDLQKDSRRQRSTGRRGGRGGWHINEWVHVKNPETTQKFTKSHPVRCHSKRYCCPWSELLLQQVYWLQCNRPVPRLCSPTIQFLSKHHVNRKFPSMSSSKRCVSAVRYYVPLLLGSGLLFPYP